MENVLKTTKADEKALLEAESRYCSYGDTVHYLEPAKLFAGCNGSFLYDYEDKPYLDLQMWYSAVNFGYANPRLNDALKRQIDTLPQVASQYLHKEKIELAAMLCESIKDAWGEEGRVHFNVGGSQAIEDSLKLVRNACGGKSLMIAFEGGYHGRTLGASSITSSYRYRRRYGHFGERALFVPSRTASAAPTASAATTAACSAPTSSSACSKPNITACGTPRPGKPNTPRSMWNASRARAAM